MIPYIFLYYAVINTVSFLMFASDKKRAVRKKWRIPERTLLAGAALGGGAGALAAMLICRHKTRKMRFILLVPFFILLHLMVLAFICRP